jgi:hypothetical protein
MNRRISMVALVGLVGALVGCKDSAELRDFESVGSRFSVKMPGQPKETMQTAPSSAGVIHVTLFASEISDNRAFVVAVTDLPAGTTMDPDVAVTAAAANVKGTMVSKDKATVDGRKGIEGLIKTPNGVFVRIKACTVGSRLYQLQTIGPDAFVKSDAATKFYDSFKAKQ